MDTTETAAPETPEITETDTAFDEGWSEAPAESAPESPTEPETVPETPPEPEPTTEPEPTPAPAEEPPAPEQPQPEQPQPGQPQPEHPPAPDPNYTALTQELDAFGGMDTVRDIMGLMRELSEGANMTVRQFADSTRASMIARRDKVDTALTQELDAFGGMDTVRDIMGLMRELSEGANMTVRQFADSTRASMIARRDKVDMAVAQERVKTERLQKADQARRQQEAARQAEEQRRNADFADFVRTYPAVQAKDIPAEVWQSVRQGRSLVAAYAMHEARTAQAEIARLKSEAEAAKKNEENRQKAAPSAGTAGARNQGLDAFDEGWNID